MNRQRNNSYESLATYRYTNCKEHLIQKMHANRIRSQVLSQTTDRRSNQPMCNNTFYSINNYAANAKVTTVLCSIPASG
jgi:hypothetical protein